MKNKVLKKSPLEIVLYVISALLLVYVCYLIFTTVKALATYTAQAGVAPAAGEIVSYILQTVIEPLVLMLLTFTGGRILNETRALNPNNYEVVEETAVKKEETPVEKKTEEKKVETKTAEKKPAAKKEPAKKAPAKKTTTAKKPAAKKEPAKKATTTKKPAAKKTTK